MGPESIGLIGILILLILMGAGMWIGSAMAVVGIFGLLTIRGVDQTFSLLGTLPVQQVGMYTLSVMPMFILMGMIVAETKLGKDLYAAAYSWLGNMRGGLASATIFASGLMGAITGGAMNGIVVMSKVALPEMKRYKYDDALATGSIAAGGTIASLIPPSISFLMYGLVTEQSVGKLFMAGFIPGVIQVFLYMIAIYVVCTINPSKGPAGQEKPSLKQKLTALRETLPVLLLFIVVMGGIYGGYVTPTEAGAFGAFGAAVIAIAMRRLTFAAMKKSLLATGILTGVVLLLMIGVSVFNSFITVSQLPFMMSEYVQNMNVSSGLILLVLLVMFFIMGLFIPPKAIIVLALPVVYPIIISAGIDPIWFGVLVVKMTEIGAITPPVGMNVLLLGGFSGISINTIYKGILPFLITDFVHVALLVSFPILSLYLPNLM